MGEPEDGVEKRWTKEKFNARFDEVLQFNRFQDPDYSYPRAYEAVEEEHLKLFGSCRFSSYDSFRHIRKNILFP